MKVMEESWHFSLVIHTQRVGVIVSEGNGCLFFFGPSFCRYEVAFNPQWLLTRGPLLLGLVIRLL